MITVGLVPLHKRPVFTSFFGMAFGVSSVLGPVVGGTFTDSPYVQDSFDGRNLSSPI
jgi:MFS family permease